MRRSLAASVLTWLACSAVATSGEDRAGIAFFESKIRPVLVERCHQCHSQTLAKAQGRSAA